MPIYVLDVKLFSRTKGARATRAAAYRAGERIHDHRTGETYNYTARRDIAHKEIILPAQFAEIAEMTWARDRATLWNAVERTERINARLAREVLVVLPSELSLLQRTQLVRGFSQELADRYRCAVDTAIHLPRDVEGERNHHAHLLMTPREVTSKGLGPRTTLELSGTERHAIGLGPSKQDLLWIRERWAQVTNEALHEAGLTARIDHRGLRNSGIDREPVLRLPLKIFHIERNTGVPTQVGDRIRREHRERVDARQKGPDELARVIRRQKEQARQWGIERTRQKEALAKQIPRSALNKEELAQERRDQYHDRKRQQQELAPRLKPTAAQQSVERWTRWREQQKDQLKVPPSAARRARPAHTPTAEESVRNWLAFRKSQQQLADDNTQTTKRRDRTRDQDHDHGL